MTIKVDTRKRITEASVPIDELLRKMVPAGTLFFERLRLHVVRVNVCDRYIDDLAALGRGGRF